MNRKLQEEIRAAKAILAKQGYVAPAKKPAKKGKGKYVSALSQARMGAHGW